MDATSLPISPLKRRQIQGDTVFSPSLSLYKMKTAATKSLQHQSVQHRGQPLDPFVVCSPLVCRTHGSIKLLNEHEYEYEHEKDTVTSTPSAGIYDANLVNVNPTPEIFDSIEMEILDFMSSNMAESGEQEQVRQASLVHAQQTPRGNQPKEGRAGIRTRSRFQPSQKYEKVWEDNNPPSAAAKTRHSAAKARSTRFNEQEQTSLDVSLLKRSSESTGKRVKITKKRAVRMSRRPSPAVSTNKRSSKRKTNAKSSTQVVNTCITPSKVDVLFGRSGKAKTHNTKFREEINKFAGRYRGTAGNKKKISAEVINAVKGYGGRFLAFDDGSWQEVDDSRAMTKVSQGKSLLSSI